MTVAESKTLLDGLVEIHLEQDQYHTSRMTKEEAYKYFSKLLEQGNILSYVENNELLGYVEFWRINFEQLGRLVCHDHFSAYNENVLDGNIAYLANTWINPEYRFTNAYRVLKMNFLTVNYKCKYFIGRALRKKHQPIKVFNRQNILKEGV